MDTSHRFQLVQSLSTEPEFSSKFLKKEDYEDASSKSWKSSPDNSCTSPSSSVIVRGQGEREKQRKG